MKSHRCCWSWDYYRIPGWIQDSYNSGRVLSDAQLLPWKVREVQWIFQWIFMNILMLFNWSNTTSLAAELKTEPQAMESDNCNNDAVRGWTNCNELGRIRTNPKQLHLITFAVSSRTLAISATSNSFVTEPGSALIKRDQPDPWIKDQIKIILLSTISPLQLPNFVSCGRDKPSHMTQNFVTARAKLWTAERFLVDPWSMDQADLVW